MDWVEIAALAVIGGLSGGIAHLLLRAQANSKAPAQPDTPDTPARDRTAKPSRGAMALVTMVSFLALSSIYQTTLKPLNDERRLRNEISKIPFLAIMAEKEPEIVKHALTTATKNGKTSFETVKSAMRNATAEVTSKYLPLASDEAVVRFIRVMVDTLRARQAQSGTACFLTLFPKAATVEEQPLISNTNLPVALDTSMLDAMADLLRSARPVGTPVDLAVGEARFLGTIAPLLQERFGARLALMENVGSVVGRDRDTVCDISIAMYSAVLALDVGAADVIRFLMSH